MSRLERLYAPPEIGAPGKRAAAGVRRDLILAGLFVLTMAAMVVATLALILPWLFAGSIRLHAYFPEAAGLDAGIQISQAGYVIGVVEAVEAFFPAPGADPCPPEANMEAPMPPTDPSPGQPPTGPCFRATLRIRAGWPIPRDSVAQLASAGLLQDEALTILPGRDSDHPLADGDTIRAGGRQADLVEQLAKLTDSLQTLVEQTIAPALAGIAEQIAGLQALLGTAPGGAGTGDGGGADATDGAGAEPSGRERLAGVFENLQRLSANLDAAVDPEKLSGILGAVEQIAKDLAGVSSKLTDQGKDVQKTVKDYGTLATDLRALVQRNRPAIERSLTDSQYLLQELAASLAPILEHIETTSRNLAELSRDLRDNPAVIIQGRAVRDNAQPDTGGAW